MEDDAYLISCTKGILDNPFRLLSEVILSKMKNSVGVLSGPNLAKEIAENKVPGNVAQFIFFLRISGGGAPVNPLPQMCLQVLASSHPVLC